MGTSKNAVKAKFAENPFNALGSIELRNKRQGPRTKCVTQHKVPHGTEFPADSEYRGCLKKRSSDRSIAVSVTARC